MAAAVHYSGGGVGGAGLGVGGNDLQALIRVKERELHEIHDMRCGQLEKLVEERDGLLMASHNRFEQLKEDFRYNLTLLEARDAELARLEMLVEQKEGALLEIEAERRAVAGRLEVLELRDADRIEKHNQDKATSKRILQELKDVIESMRWAAQEESKAKQREIDTMREDMARLALSREESLESQRRDLTRTFEALLQQREDSFSLREREIGSQVTALDTRFEQLQTENSRVKSDYWEAQRRIEHLTEEAAAKEESCRQLQWRLDDERLSKQQGDDSLQRRLQHTTMELAALKETTAKDLHDMQIRLDKAQGDSLRENEFRVVLERRMEESRAAMQQSITHLEKELVESLAREHGARRDVEACREERDTAVEQCLALRVEFNALQGRNSVLDVEVEALRQEVVHAKARTHSLETQLADTHQQLSARIADDSLQEQIRELKRVHAEGKAQIEELAKERDAYARRMEQQLAAATAELEQERLEKEQAANQLKEEQSEAAALRLRLRLVGDGGEDRLGSLQYSSQLPSNPNTQRYEERGPLDTLRSSGDSDLGFNMATSVPPSSRLAHLDILRRQSSADAVVGGSGGRSLGLGVELAEATSPIFSEDFGPVSLPTSPTIHPSARPGTLHHQQLNNNGLGMRSRQQQQQQHIYQQQQLLQQQQDVAQDRESLMNENERLKKIVREMRADIENLNAQVLDRSAAADDDERGGGRGGVFGQLDRSAEHHIMNLESRLESTMEEVTRLRNERKRLMDVGNELRAALSRRSDFSAAVDLVRAPSSSSSSGSDRQHNQESLQAFRYHPLPLPPSPHHHHNQQQQQQQQLQPIREDLPPPRRKELVQAWTDGDFNPNAQATAAHLRLAPSNNYNSNSRGGIAMHSDNEVGGSSVAGLVVGSGVSGLPGHADLASNIIVSGSHLDPTINTRPVSNTARTTQSQLLARQKLGSRAQGQTATAGGRGSGLVSGRGGAIRRVFKYSEGEAGDVHYEAKQDE